MGKTFRQSIFTLLLPLLSLAALFGGEKERGKKILILGDSHAYALEEPFSRKIYEEDWHVEVKGISSSGLARRDFYDWLAFTRSDESDGYDLYFVILGTNDGQNSMGRERELFGTSDWEYLYAARVESLITELSKKGTLVWVAIPQPRERDFRRKTEYVQAIIDEVCRFHHVPLLDTATVLGRDFRREDGIHLNAEGIDFLSLALMDKVEEVFPH